MDGKSLPPCLSSFFLFIFVLLRSAPFFVVDFQVGLFGARGVNRTHAKPSYVVYAPTMPQLAPGAAVPKNQVLVHVTHVFVV